MSCVTVQVRNLMLITATVLLVGAGFFHGEALAGSGGELETKFVGFGSNPDFYAVQQEDDLAGKNVIIYQIGNPAPAASMSLEGTSLKKALQSATLAPYAITDAGVTGVTAPQGYSIAGKAVNNQYQIGITNGSESVTLGYAPILGDPSGMEFATVTVKSVHWTADGTRVVIILNQKLSGDWPVNTDTVAAFKLQAAAPAAEAPAKKDG